MKIERKGTRIQWHEDSVKWTKKISNEKKILDDSTEPICLNEQVDLGMVKLPLAQGKSRIRSLVLNYNHG